ncbi:uncharacterized protein LOC134839562 isoform X2 [Symsagittifera roscoffensis]|uniref:uncharacterized protein LOC134839562 isoform X2 n=1 Tax=Symsagittifera roscoffensis TaxID=84072 RepID=UPI00307BB693
MPAEAVHDGSCVDPNCISSDVKESNKSGVGASSCAGTTGGGAWRSKVIADLKETYNIKYQFRKHFLCTHARVSSILKLIFSCSISSDLEEDGLVSSSDGASSTSGGGNIGKQQKEREYFTVTITPIQSHIILTEESARTNLAKAKKFVRNNYHEGPFYERTFGFPADSLICYCLNGLIWRYALDITLESEMKVFIRSAGNRDRPDEGKEDYEACKHAICKFLLMEKEKKNNYDPNFKHGLGNCSSDDWASLPENIAKFLPSRRHTMYNGVLKSCGVESRFFVPGLRHVILDVSNIAMVHGQEKFSWPGVKIAYDHFCDLGHEQLTLIVPHFRRHKTTNPAELEIIEEFERKDVLKYTQSRLPQSSTHDDRFMLQLAQKVGAVIVSNDKFSDLARENPAWRELTRDFVCTFIFVKDVFLLALDPQGREGDRLPRVLRKFDPKEVCCGTAAMYCKFGELCNYGKKCKYLHRTVKENRRMRSKRHPSGASNASTSSSGSYGGYSLDDSDSVSQRFRPSGAGSRDTSTMYGPPPAITLHEAYMQGQNAAGGSLSHFGNGQRVGLGNVGLPMNKSLHNSGSLYPQEHRSDFSDCSSLASSGRNSGSMMSLLSTGSSSNRGSGSQHGDNLSLLSGHTSFVLAPVYESPLDDSRNANVSDTASMYGSIATMDSFDNSTDMSNLSTSYAAMAHSSNNQVMQSVQQQQMIYMPGQFQQQQQLVAAQQNVSIAALNVQMENMSTGRNNNVGNGGSGAIARNGNEIALKNDYIYQPEVEAITDKVGSPTAGTSADASSQGEANSGNGNEELEDKTNSKDGNPTPEQRATEESKKKVALHLVPGENATNTEESEEADVDISRNEIGMLLQAKINLQAAAQTIALVAELFPVSLCLLASQLHPGINTQKQKFCMVVSGMFQTYQAQHSDEVLNSTEFWDPMLNSVNRSVIVVIRLLRHSGYPLFNILMMFPEVLSEKTEKTATLTARDIRERIRPFVGV